MKYKNSKKEKLHYEAVFLHEEKRKEIIDYSSVIWKAGIITSTVDIITVYFVLWKKDIK